MIGVAFAALLFGYLGIPAAASLFHGTHVLHAIHVVARVGCDWSVSDQDNLVEGPVPAYGSVNQTYSFNGVNATCKASDLLYPGRSAGPTTASVVSGPGQIISDDKAGGFSVARTGHGTITVAVSYDPKDGTHLERTHLLTFRE